MARIKLRLKKLPRSAKIKRWCLEDLGSKKERCQEALEEEIAKCNDGDDRDIQIKWTKLRENI